MLITLARKPLQGSVSTNVLAHGVGALNVDACRIEGGKIPSMTSGTRRVGGIMGKSKPLGGWKPTHQGRWPANMLLTDSEGVLAGFPEVKGATSRTDTVSAGMFHGGNKGIVYPDSGSAARFFKKVGEC